MAVRSVGSVAGKQGIDLATERGELRFKDVPDQPVVHLGVAVNHDAAEVDDGAVLADPGRKFPVELGERRERFTDDLRRGVLRLRGSRRVLLADTIAQPGGALVVTVTG